MSHPESVADRLHRAMHRLPGIPAHESAHERNGNRPGRVRALLWNTGVNGAARARAARWNSAVNESGAVRAARWNANAHAGRVHARPPRVLARWQEFLASLGRDER